ncbi:uncharacterized protein LOC124259113 [Haliotis rubra]|uniref:uncharacterized protein LOC124259113 n=1 Tax=Haliotis rubra TaxID=36100 RepID=UPI001EE571DB|nr:uncharacterized protein LOC124259113 [Haliotis rubra]
MQSSIALLCLVLVCAHSTMSNAQDTQDTHIRQVTLNTHVTTVTQVTTTSRHRPFVSVIVDGLTNKFSKHLASIFDLDKDDFKDILKALGKLKLAVLKALLNKFFDLKDKHHDFGSAQNVQRVSQMMESLEKNIQQRDILDGLTTKFSKYLPSIFKLDEDDFKDILKALGKLKLAVLKALLNKFFDLKDKHHDFGSGENFQRVSLLMESLEENIQQQELASGASTAYVAITSLAIPLLAVIA